MSEALRQIVSYVSRGHYAEALVACDEVLAGDPAQVEAIVQKAWLLGSPMPEVSAPDRALAFLREAIARLGEDARLQAALGYVYDTGLGDYASAAKAYRTAITLGTGAAEYVALALLWRAPGSGVAAEEARQTLEMGVVRHPHDWQLWRELGLLRWHSGHATGAIEALGTAAVCLSSTGKPQDHTQIRNWIERIRSGRSYGEGL